MMKQLYEAWPTHLVEVVKKSTSICIETSGAIWTEHSSHKKGKPHPQVFVFLLESPLMVTSCKKKTERPVDLISLIPFKYRAMEFAALLSFILVDYVDGILISALLLVNASIGMFSPIACVSSAECLQG